MGIKFGGPMMRRRGSSAVRDSARNGFTLYGTVAAGAGKLAQMWRRLIASCGAPLEGRPQRSSSDEDLEPELLDVKREAERIRREIRQLLLEEGRK